MVDELERLFKQLAIALHERAEADLAGQWTNLTLDARYDGEGGVLAKIRADTIDKQVSIKTDKAIDLLLISLDSCRKSFSPEWYGILMTISPSMDCNVDFNYDSECEQDSSFFDS